MKKRKPKLSDVLICPTPIRGVRQLAIYLAKRADLKRNPAKHAVVIWVHENGDPDIVWSELDVQDLDTMRRYFNMVVDEIFREQWRDQLGDPEDCDDSTS